MAERPTLTVTDSVNAFQIERRALQRMLSTSQINGAYKDARGRWKIPVVALQTAGIPARKTWISDATNSTKTHDDDATNKKETLSKQGLIDASERDSDATGLRQHVTRLEAQLETEKRLREAAERNAEDLRTALRMIEAAPSLISTPPSHSKSKPQRWWQRRI